MLLLAFLLTATCLNLVLGFLVQFRAYGRGLRMVLLALSGLSSDAKCGLLVNSAMPEADKEVRRYLGFTVLEKPCTPEELFDKLLGIVGLDRRQKTG